MSVRILMDGDHELACLYCSTSEVAFGPVFSASESHNADERAEAFLRWIASDACPWSQYERNPNDRPGHRDLRHLTAHRLEEAYLGWLTQELDQWRREAVTEAS